MLSIRPATIDDARTLFEWRNDPVTRAMSRNTHPVEWPAHKAWLATALGRNDIRLSVIERDDEPVATARFDLGEEVEFSITIAPALRARGLSLKIMRLALAQVPHCVGYVKAENAACQRLIQEAGMVLVQDGAMQLWEHRANAAPHRLFEAVDS